MNDTAQIRRCSGALRTNHFRLRPSSLLPARRPNLIISNREPLRLEIRLTHTKQTVHHHSNRENNACFRVTARTCRGGCFSPPAFRPRRLSGSDRRPELISPTRNFRPKNPKPRRTKRARNPNRHPPFLLRLKTASTFCFLQLTQSFNRTMLRLNKEERSAENRPTANQRCGDPGSTGTPACVGLSGPRSLVLSRLSLPGLLVPEMIDDACREFRA